MKNNKIPLLFLIIAILALLSGLSFGLFAALQYLIPDLFKDFMPFTKSRPFHTVSVISWILLAAIGSIYFFITYIEKLTLFSEKLSKIHFIIFALTGVAIYLSFIFGKMEGREYLSYTPILTIPILIGWLLFGFNYFKTVRKQVVNWPVYYWMWGTGIVFMIYHLSEAHFWLIPSFREDIVKDMSVQWKSYGSFVGSWNMLVYGIAIYVMSKIKNNEAIARGKTAFFFYFLGLTNLMLGWAHHTYFIPTAVWIRYLAYAVSMSEWIVLVHIINTWRKTLTIREKKSNSVVFKLLIAADFWIFLNIILALLFSIPAINYFTHGTHVTVAHSMGTTIGINTTILLAALFFIVSKLKNQDINFKSIRKSYYLYNISLFLFLGALMFAGAKRSNWMYFTKDIPFAEMQDSLYETYMAFTIFGFGLVVAIVILVVTLLKSLLKALKN
jgi:nitric oxide reductase subunit B